MDYQIKMMNGDLKEAKLYPYVEYGAMIKDVKDLRVEYTKAGTIE